jgi:hypothetical protein
VSTIGRRRTGDTRIYGSGIGGVTRLGERKPYAYRGRDTEPGPSEVAARARAAASLRSPALAAEYAERERQEREESRG